jgi:hypothetical protein
MAVVGALGNSGKIILVRNHESGSGIWETRGIIDGAGLFGRGTWLFHVQAHPPTPAAVVNTVEDGQLLLLTPKRRGHLGNKDDDRK